MIGTASALPNCSVFYNQFRVHDPSGALVPPFADDVCAGSIVGPVTLPASGTYTVAVNPYGTNVGYVTVRIYDVVDVTGPIPFGQAVKANLAIPGQRGIWTFTGTQNQRVSAVVTHIEYPELLGVPLQGQNHPGSGSERSRRDRIPERAVLGQIVGPGQLARHRHLHGRGGPELEPDRPGGGDVVRHRRRDGSHHARRPCSSCVADHTRPAWVLDIYGRAESGGERRDQHL